MRLGIARHALALAACGLIANAAACSFLRSLDDLGDGVRDANGTDGGLNDGDPSSQSDGGDAAPDAAADARPVCAPTVDLLGDEKNCGLCGNACLDTDTCDNGACSFAITVNESSELAVGGGWLAYNDGNAVWARKTSGGDRHMLANVGVAIERLATDGTYVFWTTDRNSATGMVGRCALPDCAGGPMVIATGQNHVHGLALGSDARVYWTTSGGGYRCNNNGSIVARPIGNVMSAELDGSDPRAMIVDPTKAATTDPTSVWVHAGTMFWSTDACSFDGGSVSGEIWKQPTAAGSSFGAVLTPVSSCRFVDLTGDTTDLAFTCEYTRVSSTPQAPASGEKHWRVESDGLPQEPRIATDGVRVFWTDSDNAVDGGASPDASSPGLRKVYAEDKSANPNSTKPTLLWSKPKVSRGLRGIAVDERAIYFSDSDDRKIRALGK